MKNKLFFYLRMFFLTLFVSNVVFASANQDSIKMNFNGSMPLSNDLQSLNFAIIKPNKIIHDSTSNAGLNSYFVYMNILQPMSIALKDMLPVVNGNVEYDFSIEFFSDGKVKMIFKKPLLLPAQLNQLESIASDFVTKTEINTNEGLILTGGFYGTLFYDSEYFTREQFDTHKRWCSNGNLQIPVVRNGSGGLEPLDTGSLRYTNSNFLCLLALDQLAIFDDVEYIYINGNGLPW